MTHCLRCWRYNLQNAFALITLWVMFAHQALPQTVARPALVAARDLPVMAWGASPSDPEQLRQMKEAGLNASGFCRVADLDRVRDAGLACFVSDPRIEGLNWEKLPPEDTIRTNIAALKREVGSRPEVLGFLLRDEAPAALMPGLGRVAGLLREAMPDKWPYVNVFPYRVSSRYMGSPDFESYMKAFTDAVQPPFLSYDNYSLIGGEMLDYFYTNLDFMRRWAFRLGKPFWNCILANAHFVYMEPTDATFHLQVYGTLAYGGRGIQYFTYFNPTEGSFRSSAIDPFGNKTATWEMLRRINNELHVLAPVMLQLHSTGVYHSPDVPDQGKHLSESRWVKQVEMTRQFDEWAAPETILPPISGRLLLGEFEDGRGRPYLMVVNKNLQHSFRISIRLRESSHKLMRVSPFNGQEEAFGVDADFIAPGAGILLRIE